MKREWNKNVKRDKNKEYEWEDNEGNPKWMEKGIRIKKIFRMKWD